MDPFEPFPAPQPPRPSPVVVDLMVAGPVRMVRGPQAPRRRLLPLMLFLATCFSTWLAGGLKVFGTDPRAPDEFLVIIINWREGFWYMGMVMAILLAHEMGHFLQAVRYKVRASLPYFIPMPLSPIGTMGAVIAMRGSTADRKQLFDIGLTGPWAGLLIAMPLAWIGIQHAELVPKSNGGIHFGDPLLFKLLMGWLRPEMGTEQDLLLSPTLLASWVGLLVTGLNMLPVGQLDGGHVAYALFGRRAHLLARSMVFAAVLFIVLQRQYSWALMVSLVMLMGTDHPPTADDRAKLGIWRRVIGFASLGIPIFCLTPVPIY